MKTVYNIQNNYDNTSNPSQQNQPSFNPIDKLIEVFEKIDHLVAENRKLYEALLQVERDKNALLTELLNGKKRQEYIRAK
ncbi:hypothetical protein [Dawidia soli]|uniref:Uncharacterized protein n=1 Tax=Dawidia soli TaxID=2782352 RepID=A0AAP2DBF6_9BACT|nr:hypothetical protein [Dawidia soli]MBT1688873.1 hypothetical protein [Dawidia soli]